MPNLKGCEWDINLDAESDVDDGEEDLEDPPSLPFIDDKIKIPGAGEMERMMATRKQEGWIQ